MYNNFQIIKFNLNYSWVNKTFIISFESLKFQENTLKNPIKYL